MPHLIMRRLRVTPTTFSKTFLAHVLTQPDNEACGLTVIISNLCGHTESAIIACGCPGRPCKGFISGVIIFSGHTINLYSAKEACGLLLCQSLRKLPQLGFDPRNSKAKTVDFLFILMYE